MRHLKIIFQLIDWFFEDSQKKITNRFEYLDGYRGFCALVVALNHFVPAFGGDGGDLAIFIWSGHFIGLFGFFVLSAFLLTYRMSKDLHKSTCRIQVYEILMKYFIRRIFRIYLPFLTFALCVKFGPRNVSGGYSYNSLSSFIFLKPTIKNHLWSIPVEIRYYFFIPIICLLFFYSRKYSPLFLCSSTALVSWLFNSIIIFSPKDFKVDDKNGLLMRFPIFFAGSIVAFVYFKYEQDFSRIQLIIQDRKMRFFICVISYIMAFNGLKTCTKYYNPKLSFHNDLYHPGIRFSLLLLLMLIGAPNDFTRLFSHNFILTKIGKYSFGVYLWHPMCILIVKSFKITKQFDAAVFLIILSLFVGILFYYLVENPMMKLGNYFIKKINLKSNNADNQI